MKLLGFSKLFIFMAKLIELRKLSKEFYKAYSDNFHKKG